MCSPSLNGIYYQLKSNECSHSSYIIHNSPSISIVSAAGPAIEKHSNVWVYFVCSQLIHIDSFVLLFLFGVVFAVDPNGVFIFYGSSWVFLIESSEWTIRTYLLQLCFGWQGNRKFYWMLSNSLKCSIKLSKNLGSKYLWWLCHFFSFFKFQLMRILIVIRLPIHNRKLNHFSCVTIHSP